MSGNKKKYTVAEAIYNIMNDVTCGGDTSEESSDEELESAADDIATLASQVGSTVEDASNNDEDESTEEAESEPDIDDTEPPQENDTPPEEPANANAGDLNQPLLRRERRWLKKDQTRVSFGNFDKPEGHVVAEFEGFDSATSVFLKFVDHNIRENVLFQTNLYSNQKGRNVKAFTEAELLTFLGINIVMGYNELPALRHYWSDAEDLHVHVIAKAMTRDRFKSFLSNLHVNDTDAMPADCADKLYKLRPFIDSLNNRFSALWYPSQIQSIDESMVAFKGRHSIKQYNPMKPIKRGFKIWVRGEMSGYVNQFEVYQGKKTNANELTVKYGLGGRVVYELCNKLFHGNYTVYFDNYFSSIPLLEALKEKSVHAAGTIRSNRVGLPIMKNDKQMKRGETDHKISDTGLSYYKWKDNKAVHLLSNFHGTKMATVTRTNKDGSKCDIMCPETVKDYNESMGGVDKADMLKSLYGIDRKAKKWWHRIFFHLIDVALVNAFVVYCRINDKVTLLDFRRHVAMGLLTMGKVDRKRGRPSSSPLVGMTKHKKKQFSIPVDIRKSNLGVHWIEFVLTRGRCELCTAAGIESRPSSKCTTCGVFLCCNNKKNCFVEYHKQ